MIFLGFFRFSLFIYHDKGAHRVVCYACCSRGQIDEDDGTVANRQMKLSGTKKVKNRNPLHSQNQNKDSSTFNTKSH